MCLALLLLLSMVGKGVFLQTKRWKVCLVCVVIVGTGQRIGERGEERGEEKRSPSHTENKGGSLHPTPTPHAMQIFVKVRRDSPCLARSHFHDAPPQSLGVRVRGCGTPRLQRRGENAHSPPIAAQPVAHLLSPLPLTNRP